jgi:hypothetical protein
MMACHGIKVMYFSWFLVVLTCFRSIQGTAAVTQTRVETMILYVTTNIIIGRRLEK